MKYDETGERLTQVKILNDVGQQQGQAIMMTEDQITELWENLPEGWTTEEI